MTHLTISNHNIAPFIGPDRKQGEGGISYLHNCGAMININNQTTPLPPDTAYTRTGRRSPPPVFPKRFIIRQNKVKIGL